MAEKIRINPKKFKAIIVANFGTVTEAARRCGYTHKGFDHSISTGYMAKSMALLVERVLEIPIDNFEYKDDNECKNEKNTETVLSEVDFIAIRKIIREEINKVWN